MEEVFDKMSHEFSDHLQSCYNMGKGLRQNPLYRQTHLLAYKRKSREEAENEQVEKTKSEPSTCISAPIALEHTNYADHSIVDFHPMGSIEHNFYHSWPPTVILKSAACERDTKWKTKLNSKDCPFCRPLGVCKDIKEFIDHLHTHHPDFIYRPLQNVNRAILTMQVNKNREENVNPLFIVGWEGYMISTRKRRNYPSYCGTAWPSQPAYPFFLFRAPIPDGYGGFIPGAPGTIDAELSKRKVRRQFSKSLNNKKRLVEEEYQCEFCWKDFPTKELLQRHVMIERKKRNRQHLETSKKKGQTEIAHACLYCWRKFPNEELLDEHIVTEHEERKFKCPQCGWYFKLKSTLERHKSSVHNGEKPFQCEQCLAKFARKENLNKHMKRRVCTHTRNLLN